MFRYKIVLSLALLIGWATSSSAKENVGVRTASTNNSGAKTAANCVITASQTDLDVNGVRARILVGGDLWWDPVGQTPYYEVPIGSGKTCIYAGSIWIGGFDKQGQLKVAGQTYRQQGANDFWGGPISKDPANNTLNISADRCAEFDRFWTITKKEVEDFTNGGEATQVIKEWPGNGNVAAGELPQLAPFYDADNDGVYDYTKGDYPYYLISGDYAIDPNSNRPVCNDYLFGDKTIWWVFNDVGNVKTETNSDPIGLEIRAQAFAFKTADEINFMTFYKYQIINRSSDSLLQTYMGVWCDPDLGNASDDYVGCDVGLGLGYVYNGDPDDDGAGGYGTNPPAVGIDFFQGPLADANDGIDNNKDGVTDEPGEQIIMSKFVYYTNTNNVPNGNPFVTDDYYDYLTGTWLDGLPITYGGDGRGNGTNPTTTPCNYMFPGTTDPLFTTNWTMATGGIQPTDMRWLQSAGQFSLAPGAINYITTGVIWNRTTSGGPLASVSLVKLGDNKAQALFDNCFKVLDGPNAPDIAVRELDQQIILALENTRNEKVEKYQQIDPTIPAYVPVDSTFDTLATDEREYRFQGYRLYQVSDATVSDADLADPAKAKLIAQIDLKDTISQIVNFNFDATLNAYVPIEKASGDASWNKGIYHTFVIDLDYFTQKKLANYKAYYYLCVSYAYNNFRPFDPNNGSFTQSRPYVQGRNNIKIYSAIPHKPQVENSGTVFNTFYGGGVQITRIEGQGNGGVVLDMSEASVNEALTSAESRALHPSYELGAGPLNISVYDPMAVKAGGFKLAFNGITDTDNWDLFDKTSGTKIDSSLFPIGIPYEQLVESNKIAIKASKITGNEPGDVATAERNGFQEATQEFAGTEWLTGVVDVDGTTSSDWILSGIAAGDLGSGSGKFDPTEVYEGVLSGTWAPFKMVDKLKVGAPKFNNAAIEAQLNWLSLASVDVVITNDKSKWTRCIVFETGEDGFVNEGAAKKFDKRKHESVDKDGKGVSDPSANAADATLTSSTGMGWFPGYAINIETGERLNMAFGENSSATSENGADMIWNPTSSTDNVNGNVNFGGGHYIYVFNRGITGTATDQPNYDRGFKMDSLMTFVASPTTAKRSVFKDCIWTSLALLKPGASLLASDVKIRLRVNRDYRQFLSIGDVAVNGSNPLYEFEIPASLEPSKNVQATANSALDLIRVVPNPYYAYSSYEKTRIDQLDNRVRIVNLPSKCKISIYTINGTLVRQFKRDIIADASEGQAVTEGQDYNLATTLDWDMKNTAGITVASGVYLIHINAGAIGEKVVKWFGIMRPIDLDSF
ncbi:hypothetical protein BH11BAC2_BH11BAC2_22080 [soil metagenome]